MEPTVCSVLGQDDLMTAVRANAKCRVLTDRFRNIAHAVATATLRNRLFLKYFGVLFAVAVLAILMSDVFEVWFSYKDHKAFVIGVQREEAKAAAVKIERFISEIQGQVSSVTQLPLLESTLDDRLIDARRFLRQVKAVTELTLINNSGREQLRVSRFNKDVVGSGVDLTKIPEFAEAMAHGVYYGPIFFRRESEPYMAISVAGNRRNTGVGVAEVNLKLIWDVVSKIAMAEHEHAYVVDADGYLIADPNISLVLRKTDMSQMAQVRSARGIETGKSDEQIPEATDIDGHKVLTAAAGIPQLGWLVFVETPIERAYAPINAAIRRASIVLVGTLSLAFIAAAFLARQLTVPIQILGAGAARIASGDLGQRINLRTGDELEGVADQFNEMTNKLEESYASLQQKIDDRTRELSDAIKMQTRYLQMLDSGFDAIILLDAEDRIIDWNRGAENLYGWTREEVLGRVTPSLFQTKFPKPLNEILANVLHDGHWEGELIHKRKDGRVITVFSRWTLERDAEGQRASILETNMDITERKEAETRIAADLADMTQLNELSVQLVRSGVQINQNLTAVVETAIGITRADKGNVQLFNDATGTLIIAAQRGFERPFLKFFENVRDDASACSVAMRAGERVVVEDVTTSGIFAGQPALDVLFDAGVRAVVSTPLVDSNGKLLGMVSTHFGKPHRPTERELRLMDLLARQTADYLERKQAEEVAGTLIREIEHRSNNLLAVIQAIASRSLSGHYSLEEAKVSFEARLQALARTSRQLTKSNWTSASLNEIIRSELKPFAERVIVEGNDASLDPKQAQDFSLALHELATNAIKYGALSNGNGTVKISFGVSVQSEAATLKFTWRETGGPPVAAPTRHGFGTTLLKATFPGARVAYAPDGLSCEIDVKLGRAHDLGPKQAGR
jgi:PAS domain S-box-containing protein